MPISLHAAIVPSFRQMVGSTRALLGKAQAWCAEQDIAPATLIEARLAADMLPFGYQVKSVAVHSQGAIEGVRAGVFGPDQAPWPDSFAALEARLDEASDFLDGLDPAELDGVVGRDMRFEAGERRAEFTAEDFLLSFSQPNLYFHANAAYAILRAQGLPIGKRDYLGQLRMRG